MKAFRRLTASIESSFESFVDRIENHEASATYAIRRMTEASSKARAQLARLRLDRDRVKSRLDAIPGEKAKWEDRARREREKDADGALQCVRRMQELESEEKRLVPTLERLTQSCDQLGAEVGKIDSKIQELKCRRSELSVRDSQLNAGTFEGAQEIEEIFDRWEARVASMEGPVFGTGDSLEAQFEKQENDEALKKRLDDLVKKQ